MEKNRTFAFENFYSMRFYFTILLITLFPSYIYSQERRGPFVKTDLFTLERDRVIDGGIFTYRIAVDADEIIAFNSCNQPYVFLINNQGTILEEIKLPYEGCLRNMEFDEFDNLMMMDNEETRIFKYVRKTKKLKSFLIPNLKTGIKA